MLELIYTSSKSITGGADLTKYRMGYVRTWDAMICHDWNAPSKASKLFRDGAMAPMMSQLPTLALQARVDGRHCWMNTYTVGEDIGKWWAADEISGNYHYDDVLSGAWSPPTEAFRPGGYVDDRRGLILYAYVNRRLHFIDLVTGAETTYMTLPGTGTMYDHLAWAGEGLVMAIDFETGRVAMVDYVNRRVLWSSVIRPCIMAAYDCLHRLIIAVEADLKVRVYTLDPVPAVLTNPAFIPATDQHRLMGSPVQTRLTGDDGEPCPDYWIHWSLLGTPKGELLKDKSQTDADGYAENYYFGPPEAGEIGEETILVSAKVPS